MRPHFFNLIYKTLITNMLSPEEEKKLYQLLDSLQDEHIQIALEIARANEYRIDSGSYDRLIRFLGDAYFPLLKRGDLKEKLNTILHFQSINRYFTKKTDVQIPEKIHLFKKVSHLSLVGTIDQLHFPKSFEELASLKSLRVNGSSIVEVPEPVFELTQLEYLNLSGNLLKSISPNIAKLQQLQTLILSNNVCLNTLPEALFELPNLRFLYINNCPIDYLSPRFAASKITYLRINGYKYKMGEDDFYYCLMDDTPFKKAFEERSYTLLKNVPLKIIQHGAFQIKKHLEKSR